MNGNQKMTKLLLFLFASILSFSVEIDPNLDTKLEQFKEASKCEFIISSGVRTPEHNKKVGGAKNSYHLNGKAYDLVKKCDLSYKELGKIATKFFNGVIVYKRHLHVDVRQHKYHKID